MTGTDAIGDGEPAHAASTAAPAPMLRALRMGIKNDDSPRTITHFGIEVKKRVKERHIRRAQMSAPVPEPDDPTPIDPVTDPPIDPVQEPQRT